MRLPKIIRKSSDEQKAEPTPIRDLLPIGSIVILKDGVKRLMVSGIMQSDADVKGGEPFDYIGVLYPEGHIGGEYQFMFNHQDIDHIIFRGYEDEERTAFVHALEKLYES